MCNLQKSMPVSFVVTEHLSRMSRMCFDEYEDGDNKPDLYGSLRPKRYLVRYFKLL